MCDSLCVKRCGGVSACYHALVILNDVMFSYFFASFLLYSSTGSAAPLCPPPPPLTPRLSSGFCLLSPCIRVSLSSPVGIDAGQQSIREFQSILFSFFLSLFPFSVLIVLQ